MKQKIHIMTHFVETMRLRAPKVDSIAVGIVIAKEPKRLYIDLGPIGTGMIYGTEYIAARDQIKALNLGNQVSVKILSLANEEGFFEVSLKEAVKEEAWLALRNYKEERTILELPVLEANRGGLIMELAGITGFLPVSQLSLEHYPRVEGGERNRILEELKKFVGTALHVRVLDIVPVEEKLIFSEKEAEEDALKEVLAKYHVGDVVDGKITAVVNFGAFIKFGDPPLEGLIHISEIDYKLIDDPNKFLKIGDLVKAQIIAIEKNRVSLSLKTLKEDPWANAEKKYTKGNIYEGKVLKINPFGAFVELDPDIHGLCHVSQFGSLARLKEMLEPGNSYTFRVESVEPKERRLGLVFAEMPGNTKQPDAATLAETLSQELPAEE